MVTAQRISTHEFTTTQGLPSNIVYWNFEDAQGSMWVATNQGVVRIKNTQQKLFTKAHGLPSNTVFKVLQFESDTIWTLGPRGVAAIIGDSVIEPHWNDSLHQALGDDFIYHMQRDSLGNTFFTTFNRMSGYFKITSSGALRFYSQYAATKGVGVLKLDFEQAIAFGVLSTDSNQTVQSVYPTLPINRIYAQVHDSMELVVAYNELWIKKEDTEPTLVHAFDHDVIYLCEFQNGYLAGIRNQGVVYFEISDHRLVNKRMIYTHNLVCHINVLRNGHIWIATSGNGIVIIPTIDLYIYPTTLNTNIKFDFYPGTLAYSSSDSIGIYSVNNEGVQLLNRSKNISGRNCLAALKTGVVGYETLYSSTGSYNTILGIPKKHFWRNVTTFNGAQLVYNNEHLMYYTSNKIGWMLEFKNESINAIEFGDSTIFYIATTGRVYRCDARSKSYEKLVLTQAKEITLDENFLYLAHNNLLKTYLKDSGELLYETEFAGTINHISRFQKYLLVATNKGAFCCLSDQPHQQQPISIEQGLQNQLVKKIWGYNNWIILIAHEGFYTYPVNQLHLNNYRNRAKLNRVAVNGSLQDANNSLIMVNGNEHVVQLEMQYENFSSFNPQIHYRIKELFSDWKTIYNGELSFYNLKPGTYTLQTLVKEGSNIVDIARIKVTSKMYENRWFWPLVIIFLFGLFTAFWVRWRKTKLALQSQQQEMQLGRISALYRQLNPHFTFNALNSIQFFLIKNNTDKALEYLQEFSDLLRLRISASLKKHVLLSEEIEAVNLYISLEQTRIRHPFDYQLEILNSKVPSQVFIPPLLIQPVIQFFIWNRVSEQHLTKIKLQIDVNELVVIKVCCNGTITNEALEEDEGVKNVKERLQLLESYTGNSYAFNLTCDTYGEGNWETVELKVPIEWGQS